MKRSPTSESCAGPSGSWKTFRPSSSIRVKWWWCPFAETPVNGFGMNEACRPWLRPDGGADLAVGGDVVGGAHRPVEAEVELELAGGVLVVAVAHVEPHRLPVGDHVEDHRAELLELVDVVAPGLGDALGLRALLGDLHPHHLRLDPAEERVAQLLLDVVGDPLQVLAGVGVEQLAGLGVVAVAVDAGDPLVPGQDREGVEVGDRGQLGLLGPEADVVVLAIGEEVSGGPVDELVAALGDLREPARNDSLAVDVAADRDLLEEDVLDPLALDQLGDLGDLLGAPGGLASLLQRLRGGLDLGRVEHSLHLRRDVPLFRSGHFRLLSSVCEAGRSPLYARAGQKGTNGSRPHPRGAARSSQLANSRRAAG